ncbi:glutamate receptor 3.1-like isoform X1 [Dioscorea cayenensis subsp. rotundata]|uniref:Glutamate receptor n=2 Tax=Dioscorea cayennensis subsp. rotundata TaxID=55577 RepID=A0AB40CB33_DIOCR|nr:glutamate receptor 3.1-like isoform X1 [Dioscorea cayenensis subsp. rotundata]
MKSFSVFLLLIRLLTVNVVSFAARPAVISMGAAFPFNSTYGRVASTAIQAAVADVNADPKVLKGSKLTLSMHDTECNGFIGMIGALEFMENDVVAIVGPQCSLMAHIISHIANELHVPLLSYGATDPTLSILQFPYFVRTTQSDGFQMQSIAEIIDHYQWRQVIAIFIDDENGRNAISALGDKLAQRRCMITFKAALPPNPTRNNITDLLIKVGLQESRVIVLHANPTDGITIFSVANYLQMTDSGYVWIATDWLVALLDSRGPLDQQTMDSIQGVVSLRMHTADSARKAAFTSRWSKLVRKYSGPNVRLNSYGFYAYDSVWILARALDEFFNDGGLISFSNDSNLSGEDDAANLNLQALSVFDGGKLLIDKIRRISMKGLTGLVQFDQDGNLIHPAFDIFNVVGSGLKMIGYWSNYSGLSVISPEKLYNLPPNRSSVNQKLKNVIWPGDTVIQPRGWVFANNGEELKIGVPNRVNFQEFISKDSKTGTVKGYCVDVFVAAVNLLPYPVPYKFVTYGDGIKPPNYDEILYKVANEEINGAVGDFSIITNRTMIVDFTQPFIESGLVVVTLPKKSISTNPWAFAKPFTANLWCVTGAFFILVGVVIWILERRENEEFNHHGEPMKQIVTIFWFSFSTLFFTHQEEVASIPGRMFLIIWLFVVLIIQSSYTASLTSILTVQQLVSNIQGIDSLIASGYPIGVPVGSLAENYLVKELNVPRSRVQALASPDEYARSLELGPDNGGVAGLVYDRAYLEIFLSTHCQFTTVGSEFTKAGWGFAFPRESPLATDLSTAILQLSENGDLQKIRDKWLTISSCTITKDELESNRLHLRSFWDLFLISGLSCIIALIIYYFLLVYKYISSNTEYSFRGFLTFANKMPDNGDKKEEKS